MYRLIIAFVFSGIALQSADAALEFSGYMRLADRTQFVLIDAELQISSGWLAVGDTFRDCKIVAFDPREETLVVDRAGSTIRLHLRSSRITAGAAYSDEVQNLAIALGPGGTLIIDHHPATLADIERFCRDHAHSSKVAVSLHQIRATTPQDIEAANSVTRLLGTLIKEIKLKCSVSLVDDRAPK
jgi:hypothetical protein